MKKIMMMLMALTASSSVLASTYTGTIQTVRIQTSDSGGVRISVQVTTASAGCATPYWYAYEYQDTGGAGKTWTAALLAAKASGQTVVIYGTGTCDVHDVEQLRLIDVM